VDERVNDVLIEAVQK